MTESNTNVPFRLDFTPDRRIDVDALEQMVAERAMRDWMLARFERRDELLAVDEENRETPQRVFIDLWNRADSDGNVRKCMAAACKALLNDAIGAAPQDWMEPLLALVATVHPRTCEKPIRRSFRDRQFEGDGVKEAGLDRRWLEAASAYRLDDLANTWRDLLAEPKYATTAYYALGWDANNAAFHLPVYYRGLSAKSKPVLLKQAIRYMLRTFGRPAMSNALRGYQPRLQDVPGLCRRINRVLGELGHAGTLVETYEPVPGMAHIVGRHRDFEKLVA